MTTASYTTRRDITGSVVGLSASFADEIQSLDVLKKELGLVTEEIQSARDEATKFEKGLSLSLIQARIQTFELTRALIENRIAAIEGGQVLQIQVPAVAPAPDKADRILHEIQEQLDKVSAAEKEAAASAGLTQALAQGRAETEKLTLAQLRGAWFQAKYGIAYPAMSSNSSTTAPANAADQPDGAAVAKETVAWADPNFPDIDYDLKFFELLHAEGFKFSGWWGMATSQSELDDSAEVSAINFSQEKDIPTQIDPRLILQCQEHEPSLIYVVDEFLLYQDLLGGTAEVTYRIDDQPAVKARWSQVTSNKGAGLFGQEAVGMISKIYSAQKLFLRIEERSGKTHDTVFKLDGGQPVFDQVANVCGVSLLDLKPGDYKAIQTLLNAQGFSAGTPDGVWGRGSKAALTAFQKQNGLPATGAIDKETLSKLGYSF